MTEPLDLATGPVLCRAANLIVAEGLAQDDYVSDDGYCTAGAIARATGLDPADWDDTPCGHKDTPTSVYRAARAASLAALRTLVGHIDPDARPDGMNRRELIEAISGWNDHDDRTTADVITAMRTAAREMEPTP